MTYRIYTTIIRIFQIDVGDHEGFVPITTTVPGVKLSHTPVTVGRPAAKPGSDAASVLAEIGLGGELERLVREGVIAVDGVKAGC